MAQASPQTEPVSVPFPGRVPPRVAWAVALSLVTAGWVTLTVWQTWTLPIAFVAAPFVVLGVLHRPRWGPGILLAGFAVLPAISPSGGAGNALSGWIVGSWLLGMVWTGRSIKGLPRSLSIWLLLFIVWTAVSSMVGDFPWRGLAVALRYTFLAAVLVAFRNLLDTRALGRALLTYAVALVPVAVYGLWKLRTTGLSDILPQLGSTERLSSFYGNPNSLGVMMGHGLVILAAFLLLPSRRFPRTLLKIPVLLSLLGGLSLLAALLASVSRASLLYALGTLAMLIALRRRLRWVVAALAIATAFLLTLAPPLWLVPTFRLGSGISYRDVLWSSGWQMLRDHPWTGVGSGSQVFEAYRPLYIQGAAERGLLPTQAGSAHNVFLAKGAEMGWPGLVLCVAFFVLICSHIPRALDRYRAGSWVHGAAAAGVFGLTLRGFFETGGTLGLGLLGDSLLFFIFAMILLAEDGTERNPDSSPAPPS